MATKWADYGISKQRRNPEKTHITKVKVHEDLGKEFGPEQERTRQQVIQAIEAGTSFITILEGREGWKKGEDVHIITVNNQKYIRTDGNRIESDNLGKLPEF